MAWAHHYQLSKCTVRPTPELFWNRTKPAHDDSDACLLWQGSFNVHGYGTVFLTRKHGRALAHQIAYELSFGPPPDETPCILHRCDTPACVNPSHLWAGTHRDNMLDMAAKGRAVGGKVNLGKRGRDTCPNGHPWTLERFIRGKRPRWVPICRICRAASERVRRQRKRDSQLIGFGT